MHIRTRDLKNPKGIRDNRRYLHFIRLFVILGVPFVIYKEYHLQVAFIVCCPIILNTYLNAYFCNLGCSGIQKVQHNNNNSHFEEELDWDWISNSIFNHSQQIEPFFVIFVTLHKISYVDMQTGQLSMSEKVYYLITFYY